jgi:hypothetical protein
LGLLLLMQPESIAAAAARADRNFIEHSNIFSEVRIFGRSSTRRVAAYHS